MTTTISAPKNLLDLVGEQLGPGEWLAVPQADIDMFAKATHDEQWIHVDVERAKAGPFGGTIAHGYLTLALLVPLWSDLLVIENLGMGVNYGLNKVRFPAPVPANSRVRLAATITGVEEVAGNGVQILVAATMECDQAAKPVCIAELVLRYYA